MVSDFSAQFRKNCMCQFRAVIIRTDIQVARFNLDPESFPSPGLRIFAVEGFSKTIH
jgi:hypothetical protein